MLKALAIAGADDAGAVGPDATYGYGFLNAKASADLIIADGGVGKRIRFDSADANTHADYPLTVPSARNVRVLLPWFDPPPLPLERAQATPSGPGVATLTKSGPAGSGNGFGTLTTTAALAPVNIEVKANGTRGTTGAYTISVEYPTQIPSHRHGVKH